MSEIGEIIKSLRGEASLREASKRIGISHTYLDTLEKGFDKRSKVPVKASPDTLRMISTAYDYSYEKLMLAAGYMDTESVQQFGRASRIKEDLLDEQVEELLKNPETQVFFKDYMAAPEEKKAQARNFLKYLLQEEEKKKGNS